MMRKVANDFDGDDGAAPLEMLAHLFDAHGWPFRRINEGELSGEVPGSWTTYQIRGIWRAEDRVLQMLSLPDLRVQDSQKSAIYELIALANEQVWLGHFEFWSKGNVLLYRHGWPITEGLGWGRRRIWWMRRYRNATGSIRRSSSFCGVENPRARPWRMPWWTLRERPRGR